MERKVWTAAELDEMTPSEVDALFQASLAKDLDEVPPAFLAAVRADLADHIAGSEAARER